MTALPAGPFGCILADPPWAFRSYGGDDLAPTQGEQPYSVMQLDDIKALPVVNVVARDALLFLWTVSHLQQAALDVGRAWGFEPVSIAFIWDKRRIGMGYWVRQEAEVCHLFKRGHPKRLNKDVRQMLFQPPREHSRKPDEQYERIERLVGGPYLEMFARQSRPGWSSWGNETAKFDEHVGVFA